MLRCFLEHISGGNWSELILTRYIVIIFSDPFITNSNIFKRKHFAYSICLQVLFRHFVLLIFLTILFYIIFLNFLHNLTLNRWCDAQVKSQIYQILYSNWLILETYWWCLADLIINFNTLWLRKHFYCCYYIRFNNLTITLNGGKKMAWAAGIK